MSLFENSRGFQIYGGNFYAAAGDIHIEPEPLDARVNQQHLLLPPDDFSLPWGKLVEDGWTGTSDAGVSGVQRRIRNTGENRHTPYHNSSRGQIVSPAVPYHEEQTETSVESCTLITLPKSLNATTILPPIRSLIEPNFKFSDATTILPPIRYLIDPNTHPQDCGRPHLLAPIQRIQEFNNFPIQGTEEHFGEFLRSRVPLWGPVPSEPTTINGGTFVSHTIQRQGEKGINILHGMVALEALHDSAESFPQPRCHPETREKMLGELQEWSLGTDPSSNVLWLHGPAGAGKSAIMQTLSYQLQDAGRLGGCFFFKRGHATRGNARALFATIAYQLAIGVPWLKGPISQIVEDNPSIVGRSIETQLRELISEPCRTSKHRDPVTILIDGLDECEGHHVHLEILRAIRNSLADYLPLRVIIASRPEAHIQEMFESPLYHGSCHLFNVQQSFDDVRKYLCSEFARIHHEHRTMANIPHPWPLPNDLKELVWKSSGYFIYASTIIKFIDDKNYRPTERLAIVTDQNSTESHSAFGSLDQLYMTILSTAPRQAQLMPILCALANFDLSPLVLDLLFEMESGDAQLVLRGLSSVFEVPLDDDEEILTHHASFYDFLRDSRRSQIFYVGSLDHRMDLARSLLKLFACHYRDECIVEYPGKSPKGDLILFITSLPPSAELLPLIQAMNPDYIFELQELEMMIPWLEKIHPAPKDLIGLWEDYLYMHFILGETRWARAQLMPRLYSDAVSLAHHIQLESPLVFRLLQVQMLEHPTIYYLKDLDLRWLLDISSIDLKTAICGLRSIIGEDETKFRELYYSLPHPSLPGEPFPWPSVSRDIACQCIHIAKDVHAGELPKETLRSFSIVGWSLQVRLSPPSPELLRDLRSFQPLVHKCGADDIYHVLKWLESFPDPPLEVIVDWTQYLSDIQDMHPNYKFDPSTAEDKWTRRQKWINDIKLSFQRCRSPIQKTLTNV